MAELASNFFPNNSLESIDPVHKQLVSA